MDMPVPIAARQNEASQLMARNGLPHVTHGDCDGGWDVMPLRCQGQHVAAHLVPQGFALGHGAAAAFAAPGAGLAARAHNTRTGGVGCLLTRRPRFPCTPA